VRQLALPVLVSRCERILLGVGTSTSKERKKKATKLSICMGILHAEVERFLVACVLQAIKLSAGVVCPALTSITSSPGRHRRGTG